MTKLTDFQTYSSGSYLADVSPWGRGNLKQNQDYTESIDLDPSSFPGNVVITSNWPVNARPTAGVNGFNAIDFGDYYNTRVPIPIKPARINDIGALSETHNLELSGETDGFDVIDDFFLTAGAGSATPHLDEIEVFLHTPSYSSSYVQTSKAIGTYNSGGQTWTLASATGPEGVRDILIMPTNKADIASGTVNIKGMLDFLVNKKVLSGSEYFNGLALGSETQHGGGVTKISSFSVNYQPVKSATGPVDCFVSGTRLRTIDGEALVEHLQVGDRVRTIDGKAVPVKWIGHRTIDCGTNNLPFRMWPVRIAAHAFGAELPRRELLISPGHLVLLGAGENGSGGCLVPIMCLINGTSIERTSTCKITYWHVELDAHNILLAENLPAESYLEWGNRDFFTSDSDCQLINPDLVAPHMLDRCRPVAISGKVVNDERRRLDTLFAMRLVKAAYWPNECSTFLSLDDQ